MVLQVAAFLTSFQFANLNNFAITLQISFRKAFDDSLLMRPYDRQ